MPATYEVKPLCFKSSIDNGVMLRNQKVHEDSSLLLDNINVELGHFYTNALFCKKVKYAFCMISGKESYLCKIIFYNFLQNN